MVDFFKVQRAIRCGTMLQENHVAGRTVFIVPLGHYQCSKLFGYEAFEPTVCASLSYQFIFYFDNVNVRCIVDSILEI